MLQRLPTIPGAIAAAAVIVAVTMVTSHPVFAHDLPTAEEIREAVSGHTYQGSMSEGGSGFAEYYAADGTIRGEDYTGEWRVEDGAMCFDYGGGDRCFEVRIDGPSMVMYKDGEIDGNGMLIEGNPLGF